MNHLHAAKSDFRESGIVQRMRKSVSQLSTPNPHVLLACSGGKDSVALAFLLAEMRRVNQLTFSIAHIHHGQHFQADTAAESVREIGTILEVPTKVEYLDLDRIETHRGVGLEEAMRRERYLALAAIAKSLQADCIVLGHHQTDQAESILLHLIRGSGVDGLAGMKILERRTFPWWTKEPESVETFLWRPLLSESLEEVTRIALQSGLPIVDDPTNTDDSFRRNAIRLRVLPLIEEIANGSTAAIARSARIVGSDAELLQELTKQALNECRSDSGLSRKVLVSMPEGMQSRVVRLWLTEQLPEMDISAERIEAVVEGANRNRGGTIIQVGAETSVKIKSGLLLLHS